MRAPAGFPRLAAFPAARAAALAAAAALAPIPSAAVTPVSPRFDAPTHARVEAQLAVAGVPEVGRDSVALAVLAALGVEPRDGTAASDEPSPQLPKVSVRATANGTGCAAVEALVRSAPGAAPAPPVRLAGTFCLVGVARWASADVRAVREGAPRAVDRRGSAIIAA